MDEHDRRPAARDPVDDPVSVEVELPLVERAHPRTLACRAVVEAGPHRRDRHRPAPHCPFSGRSSSALLAARRAASRWCGRPARRVARRGARARCSAASCGSLGDRAGARPLGLALLLRGRATSSRAGCAGSSGSRCTRSSRCCCVAAPCGATSAGRSGTGSGSRSSARGVSIYHIYIEHNPSAESASCKAGGAPCSTKWIEEFGYITLPTLALTAFALIAVLLAMARSRRGGGRERGPKGPRTSMARRMVSTHVRSREGAAARSPSSRGRSIGPMCGRYTLAHKTRPTSGARSTSTARRSRWRRWGGRTCARPRTSWPW